MTSSSGWTTSSELRTVRKRNPKKQLFQYNQSDYSTSDDSDSEKQTAASNAKFAQAKNKKASTMIQNKKAVVFEMADDSDDSWTDSDDDNAGNNKKVSATSAETQNKQKNEETLMFEKADDNDDSWTSTTSDDGADKKNGIDLSSSNINDNQTVNKRISSKQVSVDRLMRKMTELLSDSGSKAQSKKASTVTQNKHDNTLMESSDSGWSSDEEESNKDKNNANEGFVSVVSIKSSLNRLSQPKFSKKASSMRKSTKMSSSLHQGTVRNTAERSTVHGKEMTFSALLEEDDIELSDEINISRIPSQQTKASVASTRLTDAEIQRLTVNLEREISNGKIPSQRTTENTAKRSTVYGSESVSTWGGKPSLNRSSQPNLSKKAPSIRKLSSQRSTWNKESSNKLLPIDESSGWSSSSGEKESIPVPKLSVLQHKLSQMALKKKSQISNGKILWQRSPENTAKSKLSSLREKPEKESDKKSDEDSENSVETAPSRGRKIGRRILELTQKEKNREAKRESMLRYVQKWDEYEEAALRFDRFPTKRKLSPKELRQIQKEKEIRRRKRGIKKELVSKEMEKQHIKMMDKLKHEYEEASKGLPRPGKQRYNKKNMSIYDQCIEAKHKKADKKAKEWATLIGMESEQNNVIRNMNRIKQGSHLNDVVFCDNQSTIDSMIERKQKYTKTMKQMMADELDMIDEQSDFSKELAEAYELDEINEKMRHLQQIQREYEHDQMNAENIEKSPLVEHELKMSDNGSTSRKSSQQTESGLSLSQRSSSTKSLKSKSSVPNNSNLSSSNDKDDLSPSDNEKDEEKGERLTVLPQIGDDFDESEHGKHSEIDALQKALDIVNDAYHESNESLPRQQTKASVASTRLTDEEIQRLTVNLEREISNGKIPSQRSTENTAKISTVYGNESVSTWGGKASLNRLSQPKLSKTAPSMRKSSSQRSTWNKESSSSSNKLSPIDESYSEKSDTLVPNNGFIENERQSLPQSKHDEMLELKNEYKKELDLLHAKCDVMKESFTDLLNERLERQNTANMTAWKAKSEDVEKLFRKQNDILQDEIAQKTALEKKHKESLNEMRDQKQKYSVISNKYDAMRVAVSEQLNMRNSSQEMQSKNEQLANMNRSLKEQLDSKNKFIELLQRKSTMVSTANDNIAQSNENIGSQQMIIDDLKQRDNALEEKINEMGVQQQTIIGESGPESNKSIDFELKYEALLLEINEMKKENEKLQSALPIAENDEPNIMFDNIPVNEISEPVEIIGGVHRHQKVLHVNSEYLSIGKKRFYYKDIKRLVACCNSKTKWMILTNECTIRIKSKSAEARYKLMTFIQSNLWLA